MRGVFAGNPLADIRKVALIDEMDDYRKQALRYFCVMGLVPLIVGVVGAWSPFSGFILFLLGAPFLVLGILVGAIHWFNHGIRSARERREDRDRILDYGLAPTLALVTVLASWPVLVFGNFVGDLTRLGVNQSHYGAIIAKAERDQQPAWFKDDNGVTYSVDVGPPLRIAFNPEGFLDNWSGIIYDPTGDVMLADGFDPKTGKFAAPERITKLFDGDLVACRHLWGAYYSCTFT